MKVKGPIPDDLPRTRFHIFSSNLVAIAPSSTVVPVPPVINYLGRLLDRCLDTVDVARLSTPELKSTDPYNSNHVADHHDHAQPGNGFGLPPPQESGEDAFV